MSGTVATGSLILGGSAPILAPGVAGGAVVTDANNHLPAGVVAGTDFSAGNVLATGAGATAISLANLTSATPNLLTYGIVADGTTNNNAAMLALVTNQAAAAVNALFAPPGDYLVNFGGTVTAPPGLISFGSRWPSQLPNYFGATDGTVLGYAGTSPAGHLLGLFRQLDGDTEQCLLAMQSISPQQSGTTSYEKSGLYINVVQSDTSAPATGNPTFTKDFSAIQTIASVGAGVSRGRVWGATFGVVCPSGADGDLCGLEIDVTNGGTDPTVAGNPYKIGVQVVNVGAGQAGGAYRIGSDSGAKFAQGYESSAAAVNGSAFVHYAADQSTPLFSVDAVYGGVNTTGGFADASAEVVTNPASGSSLQIPDGCSTYFINNLSGTLASLTIALPPSPPEGMIVWIGAINPITALTLTSSSGIQWNPTGITQGGGAILLRFFDASWFHFKPE